MTSGRSAAIREAFDTSVARFLQTVTDVGDGDWDIPVSDEWTVHQLVAHVVRGMGVMADYLDADPAVPGELLPGASAYFRSTLDMEGIHTGIADRAIAAAGTDGGDPLAWAHDVAGSTRLLVAATADDVVIVHFAGAIGFLDYLETRICELVLHTLELQVACGLEPEVPVEALTVVNQVLLELVDRAEPLALALALSGRSGPRACNVLG